MDEECEVVYTNKKLKNSMSNQKEELSIAAMCVT